MEQRNELKRRLEDLRERSRRNGIITSTHFLTPAEQYFAEEILGRDGSHAIGSGVTGTERNIIVFLPEWADNGEDEIRELVSAVKITPSSGEPGHRDYLGSLMGLGIKREWIGDILIRDNEAIVLVLGSVKQTILDELISVGRNRASVNEISLDDVPAKETKFEEKRFTVSGVRLDKVLSSVFNLSRNTAASMINEGLVTLNYSVCQKPDKELREGDVFSLRGKGKAIFNGVSGTSKKGRLIVSASLYK